MKAETTLSISDARRHFERLCAHFHTVHDLQVDREGDRAEIILPDGWCAVEVTPGGLHLFLKAWDHLALEPMKAFFTRHLQRLVLQARTPVIWSHPWIQGVAPGDVPGAKLRMLAAALEPAAASAERG